MGWLWMNLASYAHRYTYACGLALDLDLDLDHKALPSGVLPYERHRCGSRSW